MKNDPLRIQSSVILVILILQYLLGMAANLFVQFPDTTNEGKLWEFAKGQWTIVTHMIIGLGLIIGGIVLLVRAFGRKDKNWIKAGSFGLFGILVAVITGAQFIPTQQDFYSYLMASAFIVSVLSYGWGIYKTRK